MMQVIVLWLCWGMDYRNNICQNHHNQVCWSVRSNKQANRQPTNHPTTIISVGLWKKQKVFKHPKIAHYLLLQTLPLWKSLWCRFPNLNWLYIKVLLPYLSDLSNFSFHLKRNLTVALYEKGPLTHMILLISHHSSRSSINFML